MREQHRPHSRLMVLGLGAITALSGCPTELDLSDPIDLDKTVVAQFDPTNPIPVLQLVPSPTGLAQYVDAEGKPLAGLRVRAQQCQLGTTTQCLAYATGWPLNLPITLYFSNMIDMNTVAAGVKVIAQKGLAATPVTFTATISERPAPDPRCTEAGKNGARPADPMLTELAAVRQAYGLTRDDVKLDCMPEGSIGTFPETYGPDDIPKGYQLLLFPDGGFDPDTGYLLLVESYDDEDGTPHGLRAADGSKVEPSSLFASLNVPPEMAPLEADGKVTNPLVRSNLQNGVISNYCGVSVVNGNAVPSVIYSDLSKDDKAMVDALTQFRACGGDPSCAAGLSGLYGYFNRVIGPAVDFGLTTRDKLVFANAWSTEVYGSIEFDPANGLFPFPNNQLMTSTTGPGLNDVKVNLPIVPCDGNGLPAGCDAPSAAALKGGLNTLNGFSTTAPIIVTVTKDVDADSLEGNVVMYPLNEQGMLDGAAVELTVEALARTDVAKPTIRLTPTLPLQQNQNYVIGFKRGIMDTSNLPLVPGATFGFLKMKLSLLDNMGELNPALANEDPELVKFVTGPGVSQFPVDVAIEQQLQCSTASTLGRLANELEVKGTAGAVEQLLLRERWQTAFEALEAATPAIPRNDVLMAFTLKTQDITGALDLARGRLLEPWENIAEMMGHARIIGPVPNPRTQQAPFINGPLEFAALLGVASNFCTPACLAGLAPPLTGAACTDTSTSGALIGHPTCASIIDLAVGSLGRGDLYMMRTTKVTAGNPYVAGAFNPAVFNPMSPDFVPPTYVDVPIWVVSPTGTSSVSPSPAVIFQHGFGRAKEDGFAIANAFANEGLVTVLMDLPFHGARASDIARVVMDAMGNPTLLPCTDVDPATVQCDSQAGTCQMCDAMGMNCRAACDGQQDPSATGFLSTNLFSGRDNFRQATLDHLTLLRTLQREGNAAGRLPYVMGTQVGYAGQSLGGITGGNFAAFAPELTGVVLNVPGGGLVNNILTNSVPQISGPLFAGLVASGACVAADPANPSFGCQDDDAFRQFLQIAQWVVDPGDPLANSLAVKAAHNMIPPLTTNKILIQMAIPDPVVSNQSTLALAASYGFDTMNTGMTSHFQVYDFSTAPAPSGCHGFTLAPSCPFANGQLDVVQAICATYGAQQQAAAYIASGGTMITKRGADLTLAGQMIPCPNF